MNVKEQNLISVIVPVYNVKDILYKCIDSILNQSYKNIELILIDDGSTDGSGKICDEYSQNDSRVKVIHNKNQGVSAARNTGLDVISGEYLIFVDSDDMICSDLIEKTYSFISSKKLDAALFSYKISSGENRLLESFAEGEKIVLSSTELQKSTYLIRSAWQYMYKKSAIGDIRFDTDIHFCEDLLFVTKVIYTNVNIKIGIINEPLYVYTVGRETSATNKQSLERRLTSIVALKRMLEIVKPYPLIRRKAICGLQGAYFLSYMSLNENSERKSYKKQMRHLRKCMRKTRLSCGFYYGFKKNVLEILYIYGSIFFGRKISDILRFIRM